MLIDAATHLKDLVLITLLLGALIGFWYAYNQNKSSTQHLKRMMRDMESLQKAETALEDLQVLLYIFLFYCLSFFKIYIL